MTALQRIGRVWFLIPASLFLLSCSGSHGPGLVEVARIPMPPYAPPQPQDLPDYLIDFGDLLEVKFFNNERFDELVKVRPDGRITLQRYGDLLVVGRTPGQVDSMITRSYGNIIKDPEVTVFVREFGQPEVYVLGEVERPGGVTFRGRLTALQAVALAGGPGREAKMASVLIIRQDNNQLVAARWDLRRLMKGKLKGGDPEVRPFDIVYIPRTFISKVGDFLDSYLPAILTPLDLSVRWFYYQKLLEDNKTSVAP
ncbi:MAG TPA: polysaccharide biosynthesis/export family protein [bacterium]